MPYISILIPLYNGVEFLEGCVQSILQQTYQDWEVLIGVNGWGSDGGDVAKRAFEQSKADPRIRVFVQGAGIQGKVDSLHDLLNYAEGEWISLLDVDDLWLPTKLADQMAAKQGVAKHAAVIGTFCEYFGDMFGPPSMALPSGYISPSVLQTMNPIINSSALLHRSYCHWRYTDICYGMEDYDLWMRIAMSGGKLYNVPHVLCYHRIHPASAFNSKGADPKRLQDSYNAIHFG
jgi:glycosyltransferase involved in cell wall biosynthesis